MSPTYLITTPVEVDVLWKVKADSEAAAITNLSAHCTDLKRTPDTLTLGSITKGISYRGLPDETQNIQQMSIRFASDNPHRCVVFDEIDEDES
ncbi:hypothetical protein MITS9509_00446 [Synechococcus sp. MIT S9509]|nr:hypothetical protein MITS9504_00068 [Synechococcus sp. MIT S9504]KZR93153.1 hypothetical protein MITS9509_00446 [Synechococcus sp. MIT S9509]